jgi:molybdenum cofactor biosynthesis enzyme MoaA
LALTQSGAKVNHRSRSEVRANSLTEAERSAMKFLKRVIVRYLQPTINEMVSERIEIEGENITNRVAEAVVRGEIDDARIENLVEEATHEFLRYVKFDEIVEEAITDADIDQIATEAVAREINLQLAETPRVQQLLLDVLSRIEITDDTGKVIPTRWRVKTQESSDVDS